MTNINPVPAKPGGILGIIGTWFEGDWTPALHNALCAARGDDTVMLPLPAGIVGRDAAETVRRAIALVGNVLRGLGVTEGYCADAAALVNRLSDTAAALGRVDTIAVDADGGARGYLVLPDAILEALSERGTDCRGRRAMICGEGLYALCAEYALQRAGAKVVRDTESPEVDCDILVNAGAHALPMAHAANCETVIDCSAAASTALLTLARRAGAGCISGLDVRLRAAELSQSLWGFKQLKPSARMDVFGQVCECVRLAG